MSLGGICRVQDLVCRHIRGSGEFGASCRNRKAQKQWDHHALPRASKALPAPAGRKYERARTQLVAGSTYEPEPGEGIQNVLDANPKFCLDAFRGARCSHVSCRLISSFSTRSQNQPQGCEDFLASSTCDPGRAGTMRRPFGPERPFTQTPSRILAKYLARSGGSSHNPERDKSMRVPFGPDRPRPSANPKYVDTFWCGLAPVLVRCGWIVHL